jgi:hypothetical protein
MGAPVARFDPHFSRLPPQASYHLTAHKGKSLWNSKIATQDHWQWSNTRKELVRVHGEQHRHGFRPVKPGMPNPLPINVSITNTTSSSPSSGPSGRPTSPSARSPERGGRSPKIDRNDTATNNVAFSSQNHKNTTPESSPRRRWIVEKRNRHHVWKKLAQPTRQSFGVSGYVDPSCKELLRSKASTSQASQRPTGATRAHHEAIVRISERMNRKRHEMGVGSPQSGDEKDEDLDSTSFSFYDEGAWTAPVKTGVVEKQKRLDPSRVLTLQHKAELRAGHYTTQGKELKMSLHTYELDTKIAACRRKIETDAYMRRHNPGPSRRERARQRRVRAEKIAVMIALASRASALDKMLRERREERKLYLLRTIAAFKITKWYRTIRQSHITEKMGRALKVLRRFFMLAMVGSAHRRKKQSADAIVYFLETYAKQNVSNLIRKFRRKIIRGQRCFRTWSAITRARMLVLEKLWDRELQMLRNQEEMRLSRAKREQLEFEAELLNESGAQGLGHKVLSSAKRRAQRSGNEVKAYNVSPSSSSKRKGIKKGLSGLKNVAAGFIKRTKMGKNQTTQQSSGNSAGSLAMHLLHQRTKSVMEKTKLHRNKEDARFKHLTVSDKIRTPLLENLLRKKRHKYQESLAATMHKMIARRQVNLTLSREDVRRFIQAGTSTSLERQHESRDEEGERDDEYRGFLMIKSLYKNEMLGFVLEGLRRQHGKAPAVMQ